MAPNNEYLTETSVQERLASHHNRLIKMTMTQFPGEDAETHWDFNRPVENDLLAGFLERFAEPDFVDGKVTIRNAAEHVYGGAVDEYLLGRIQGMLQPPSTFNKNHSVNGLVYVGSPDGTIARGDRLELATRILSDRLDLAGIRVKRAAARQLSGINAAYRKAARTAPEHVAELEAARNDRTADIGREAQLALGSGE